MSSRMQEHISNLKTEFREITKELNLDILTKLKRILINKTKKE